MILRRQLILQPKLLWLSHRKPKRAFGALKGAVAVTDAFFEPLSKRELAGWE